MPTAWNTCKIKRYTLLLFRSRDNTTLSKSNW